MSSFPTCSVSEQRRCCTGGVPEGCCSELPLRCLSAAALCKESFLNSCIERGLRIIAGRAPLALRAPPHHLCAPSTPIAVLCLHPMASARDLHLTTLADEDAMVFPPAATSQAPPAPTLTQPASQAFNLAAPGATFCFSTSTAAADVAVNSTTIATGKITTTAAATTTKTTKTTTTATAAAIATTIMEYDGHEGYGEDVEDSDAVHQLGAQAVEVLAALRVVLEQQDQALGALQRHQPQYLQRIAELQRQLGTADARAGMYVGVCASCAPVSVRPGMPVRVCCSCGCA
jgi:hypothetical protein